MPRNETGASSAEERWLTPLPTTLTMTCEDIATLKERSRGSGDQLGIDFLLIFPYA